MDSQSGKASDGVRSSLVVRLRQALQPILRALPAIAVGAVTHFAASPTNAQTYTGYAQVVTGDHHTCALETDGTVKCWGWNRYGQLGIGNTTNQNSPVAVAGFTGAVRQLTAGAHQTCALEVSGRVKCWGNNDSFIALLVNLNPPTRLAPEVVVGLSGTITQLAAGYSHTCALDATGGVKCWGYNGEGQLGIGNTTQQNGPVAVPGFTGAVTQLSAGYDHTCALEVGGAVKCWGRNSSGQLGIGNTTQPYSPVTVAGFGGAVTQLAAGGHHTCALEVGGTVKCWGSNSRGQLGIGNTTQQNSPVAVAGFGGAVTQLAASSSRMCAIEADSTVKCWGRSSSGQFDTADMPQQDSPVAVTGFGTALMQLAAGGGHTCALESGGIVRCWGFNDRGQLGVGTSAYPNSPVAVSGFVGAATQLVAGVSHTCALESGGTVRCWGNNSSGQLGIGNTTNQNSSVAVSGFGGAVTQLAADDFHTCALESGGTVKCWGNNSSFQLGTGNTTQQDRPVTVAGFGGAVTQLAAGDSHTCALDTGGSAKCWGSSYGGQTRPVVVSGITGAVTLVASGSDHTCEVETGAVKCFGRNNFGQLGSADTFFSQSPVAVRGFTGAVTLLVAGSNHTCALETGGTVKCWGDNSDGQLGIGNIIQQNRPVALSGFGGAVVQLASGSSHTCARETGGTIKCWGRNHRGQLGIGTLPYLSAPGPATCELKNAALDCDGDSIPNGVEGTEGTNPSVRDNDIFSNTVASQRLFVQQIYRDFLGREADAAGLAFWTSEIAAGRQTRSTMIRTFLFSSEAEATEGQAARLYFAAFQRAPDPTGLAFWASQLVRGPDGAATQASIDGVAAAFAGSAEFVARYGNLDNAGFVDRMYRNILGRAADAAGLDFWVAQMGAPTSRPRGQILAQFADSTEYRANIDADVSVTRLYLAMLRRQPDDVGRTFWATRIRSVGSALELIDGFVGAAEYRARFL